MPKEVMAEVHCRIEFSNVIVTLFRAVSNQLEIDFSKAQKSVKLETKKGAIYYSRRRLDLEPIIHSFIHSFRPQLFIQHITQLCEELF